MGQNQGQGPSILLIRLTVGQRSVINKCMKNKTPYDWKELQKLYDSGIPMRKLGPNLNTICKAVKNGWLIPRTKSQAQKLSIEKSPPRKHSIETKQKLRDHMLRRLKEGTYPTLGKNFKGRPQSYPEKWFEAVIKNRIQNQSYVKEYPIGLYSLDFAWVDLKKCIEIDGATHELTRDKDIRRDAWLKDNGWQTLRIEWKECVKDKEKYIRKAIQFIDSPLD